MAEKTFEEGRILGKVETLEKIITERGTSIEGLRTDMNGMGETIRAGFVDTVDTLKEDIKKEIALQIKPVAKDAADACSELRGNGQPGLVKRFERSNMKANLNWTLTFAIILAMIKMGLDLWSKAPPA